MSKSVLSREDYAVGWICLLEVELAAAEAMLDDELTFVSFAHGDLSTSTLERA